MGEGASASGQSDAEELLECLKPVAGFANLGPPPGLLPALLPAHYRILALSGGGANGACGAGVLAGWHANPGLAPARLDEIDLITGVSTGAIQALFLAAARGAANPCAVIGQLGQAYLETDDRQIFSNRWPDWLLPLALLTRLSRADVAPLRQRLREMVTAHFDNLRAAVNKGLKVWFGTVMLEDGGLYAASLEDLLALQAPVPAIVDVVLASSAVPIDYPPVDIGGRLFVDGGVRHTSFICEIVWQVLAKMLGKGTLEVLLLRNGTNSPNGCSTCDTSPKSAADKRDCISATGTPTRPKNLLQLLLRAIDAVMTNQIELSSQYRIAGDLAVLASRHPGITTSLWLSHLTNIDLELRGIRRPEGRIFDPDYMRAIFNFGRERATWDRAGCTNPASTEEHRGAFLRITGPGMAFDDTVPIETRRCMA